MTQVLTYVRSHFRRTSLLVAFGMVMMQPARAQTCANPGGIAYGLNGSGFIYPINVITGVVGAALNPPYTGNAPSGANALGYNNINGKFYYFKRNANISNQEFVSFDPATNLVTILTDCPTTNIIYTGCASADGAGYYCMDNKANLFYYKISTNSWTKVTSVFYDVYGFNITTTLQTLNGGDIAIDGYGSLWILCSNGSRYGLYKIVGAVPTTAIPSLTCSIYLPPTTFTPEGVAFAGIAFTSTGQILLTTLQGNDKLYRLENNLTLTYLNTLSVSGTGTDLTSCNYPLMVLPSLWKNLVAQRNNDDILLRWGIEMNAHEVRFTIEKSVDGQQWQPVEMIQAQAWSATERSYRTTIYLPTNMRYMLRIKMVEQNGQVAYSPIKMIPAKEAIAGNIWPNPTQQWLYFEPLSTHLPNKVQVFDATGKMVLDRLNELGDHQINLATLQPGTYQIRISNSNGSNFRRMFVKG